MEKQRLAYLLERHLANQATAQERQELSAILNADTHRDLLGTMLAEMMKKEKPAFPRNREPWQKIMKAIVRTDKAAVEPVKTATARVFRLQRWAAAAAVLLLVSTGIFFLLNRMHQLSPVIAGKTQPGLDIIPVSKNTLTLSNGSHIPLDETVNGRIASQENTIITKQDRQIMYETIDPGTTTHYNVISTARGGQYEVVLPDGSQVWLNSASSIRFPASFTGNERSVELSGEAWFDVKHADKIPFHIHSGAITTSVMGTAFDIKAYPGQQALTVSVQRGKVRVQAGNKLLATLQKGQQVSVYTDSTTLQKGIDSSSVAAWKQGDLRYKDEVLADIIADLQRVFNESIEIKRASLGKEITTVSFNKNIGIQNALEIISRVTDTRVSHKNGIFIIE